MFGRGEGPIRAAALAIATVVILVLCSAPTFSEELSAKPAERDRKAQFAERDRLWKEATALRAAGQLELALQRLADSIKVQQSLFGADSIGEAQYYDLIAQIERDRERWTEALAAAKAALAIWTKLRSADGWRIVDARLAVADIERLSKLTAEQRARLAEAAVDVAEGIRLLKAGIQDHGVARFEKARNARVEVLGEQHRLAADAFATEGAAYNELRNYAKALQFNLKALEIRQQVLGKSHPDYAVGLNNLAFDYEQTGDLAKAVESYREAAAIQIRTMGEADATSRTIRRNLVALLGRIATDHQQQQQFAEARKCREEIINVNRLLWGADHWKTVDARLALADVDLQAKLTPEQRRQLAQTHGELTKAESLAEGGKPQEAIALFERVHATRLAIVGEQHPLSADVFAAEGSAFNESQDYQKALVANDKAVKIRAQVLGTSHPDYAVSLNNLGFSSEQTGNPTKAAELYREAARIAALANGANNANARTNLENLVNVLDGLATDHLKHERFAEARKCREESLTVVQGLWGSDHWKTIDARLALADVDIWAKLTPQQRGQLDRTVANLEQARKDSTAGKHPKAIALVQSVLVIRRMILGEQHRLTAQAYGYLDLTYFDASELANARPACEHAVKLREQILGKSHPDYANSILNLAFILDRTGELAKAADLLREAADIRARADVEGGRGARSARWHLIRVLDKLAAEQMRQQQFADARKSRQEIVSLDQLLWGADDTQTVEAKLALADVDVWARLTADERRQLDQATADLLQAQKTPPTGKQQDALALARSALATRTAILGPRHRLVGSAASWAGQLAQKSGDFAAAKSLFEQALESNRKLLGEAHPDVAACLNNLAALYDSQGDYAQAEPLYEQALTIWRKLLGDWHPTVATGMNNLALLYVRKANYLRAEPLLEQALETRRKTLGASAPATATSLDSLASLYDAQGDYARAEPLYKQALEIRRKTLGESHTDFATSLNNLALLYDHMGDYKQAEPLYEQAVEIHRKVVGEMHPDFATSLNNLALLYDHIGDYTQATLLCKQALEIRRQALGEAHPAFATNLNTLAGLYDEMGDYVHAAALCEQALEIRRKTVGEAHPAFATNLNNLAWVYDHQGDYARAEPLFKQALALRRKTLSQTHPDVAESMDNLAMLYHRMGDHPRAEPLYKQALEIRRQSLGEHNPIFGQSLNNLAALYNDAGDYVQAEPLYKQAMEIDRKALGEMHPRYAASLHNLAGLYVSMGDDAKAEPLCKQALEIRRKVLGEAHPDFAASLTSLAFLAYSRGDYAQAEPLHKQALDIIRSSLDTTSLAQSERQQLAMAQAVRYQLDNYVSLGLGAKRFAHEVFAQVLAWKGATLVRQRAMRLAAADPTIAAAFGELRQTTIRLATLSRAVPEKEDRQAAWRAQLDDLVKRKEQLEANLSTKSVAFRQSTRRVAIADLLAHLPADVALVDFLEFSRSFPPKSQGGKLTWERQLVAFVIRHADSPDDEVTMVCLGAAEPVRQAIDTWRLTYGGGGQGEAAGRLLRDKLWEPLLPTIGAAPMVLVSTDGSLGRLPLGALPGKKPGTYLLEDHRLAMVPVPQLLPALLEATSDNQLAKGLLLLGNIDYDALPAASEQPASAASNIALFTTPTHPALRAGEGRFVDLPGTRAEVHSIGDLLGEATNKLHQPSPGVELLSRSEATKDRFRELAPRFRYLHLATHGFFAPASWQSAESEAPTPGDRNQLTSRSAMVAGFAPGLLSGLALSGANRPPVPNQDDGILTAEEIACLPLDGVRLVTLSACESGLGKEAGGEGLLGLQRAFQVSGAHATIASYWKVADDVTQIMMVRFYRNLWERQMGSLDALREAQLWVLRSPDARTATATRGLDLPEEQATSGTSPRFWAAFSLSGDWR